MPRGRPRNMENLFKPDTPVRKHNSTPSGQAGYDNSRENIDPHVRTQAVTTKQGTIQDSPVNNKDILNLEYFNANTFWQRNASILSPKTAGDDIETTGDILGGGIVKSTDSGRDLWLDTVKGGLAQLRSNTLIYIRPSGVLVGWFSSTQFGFYNDKRFQFGQSGTFHGFVEYVSANKAMTFGVDGADVIISFVDDLHMKSDSIKTYYGAGDDSTISYNGTDLIINSAAVGTGITKFSKGVSFPISKKTADYTILTSDYTILADGTSNTIDITLPASPKTGQVFNIKCIDDTNLVTIARNGKNIDGDASDLTLIEDESVTLQYDGTEWWII